VSLKAVLAAVGGALALAVPGAARADQPGPAGRPQACAIREALNVRYHKGSGRQKLDVFAPRDAERRPVVLFVHGGAWTVGDKNLFGLYRNVGRFFARHGVVAVLINYRLSPWVKHPEHVKDVARAFAWTHQHIADYGGDPGRIVLCGHSAGGHLVALLATDDRYLKDPALKLGAEGRAALRGVIAVCGVYRIPAPDEFVMMAGDMVNSLMARAGAKGTVRALTVPALMRRGKNLNLFRMVFGDGPAALRDASPLSHVQKGLPPFLILYAQSELPRLAGMANDFGKALREAGNTAEVRQVPGCTHNTILFRLNRPDDAAANLLLEFVTTYAGGIR
jgi:acetyl esterase/lipase